MFRNVSAAARSGERSRCIARSWNSELMAQGSYAVRAKISPRGMIGSV